MRLNTARALPEGSLNINGGEPIGLVDFARTLFCGYCFSYLKLWHALCAWTNRFHIKLIGLINQQVRLGRGRHQARLHLLASNSEAPSRHVVTATP